MENVVFTEDERQLLVVLVSRALVQLDPLGMPEAHEECETIIRKLGRSDTTLIAVPTATR